MMHKNKIKKTLSIENIVVAPLKSHTRKVITPPCFIVYILFIYCIHVTKASAYKSFFSSKNATFIPSCVTIP